MSIQTIISGPLFRASFSTANPVAQKTFAKFTQRYAANLAQFQKKVNSTTSQGDNIKRSTQKAYVHPLNDGNKRVVRGVRSAFQVIQDSVGPQQVSAHYQHFSFARRQALIFLGGLAVLRFIATTEDLYVFGQSGTFAWTFYFGYNYFWLQGKKYFLMPFLTRFYRKLLNMELSNVQTYWAQNTEARVRNLMSTARQQIQYKSVHTDYLNTRNNALLSYLINEQIALKNHIHARAENVLKETEIMENLNQNKIISDVMSETLQSIDKAYKQNKSEIDKAMFDLALEGIALGKMDYAKDPILPFVVKTINKTVQKFNSISKEDQEKLVALTEDQMTAIRNADIRARDQFILSEPKIQGSLRNNPIVSKVLQSWGK